MVCTTHFSSIVVTFLKTEIGWTPKQKLTIFWSLFGITLSVLIGWDSRNEEETKSCDTTGGTADRGDHRQRSSPCESSSRTSGNREGERCIEGKTPYTQTLLQRMAPMVSETASCSWSVAVVLLYLKKIFCNWSTRSQHYLEVLVIQIFHVTDRSFLPVTIVRKALECQLEPLLTKVFY